MPFIALFLLHHHLNGIGVILALEVDVPFLFDIDRRIGGFVGNGGEACRAGFIFNGVAHLVGVGKSAHRIAYLGLRAGGCVRVAGRVDNLTVRVKLPYAVFRFVELSLRFNGEAHAPAVLRVERLRLARLLPFLFGGAFLLWLIMLQHRLNALRLELAVLVDLPDLPGGEGGLPLGVNGLAEGIVHQFPAGDGRVGVEGRGEVRVREPAVEDIADRSRQ